MEKKYAENSWESYKALVKKADKVLDGKPVNANLNGIIHSLIWHRGLCPARWILENVDLIKRLSSREKPSVDDLALLKVEIESSIRKLTKY